MFARVSTFQGTPGQEDKALAGPPPPEVQQMAGFRGAYTLFNRKSGKAMLITLWDTEEAMQASAEVAKQVRARTVQETGGTAPAQVETYEILSHP